jgi:hypothetical protein
MRGLAPRGPRQTVSLPSQERTGSVSTWTDNPPVVPLKSKFSLLMMQTAG